MALTKKWVQSPDPLEANMKTIKFKLTLEVEFDPQGTPAVDLERHLYQVVKDATSNGTLTGDTPATVEHYSCAVHKLRS